MAAEEIPVEDIGLANETLPMHARASAGTGAIARTSESGSIGASAHTDRGVEVGVQRGGKSDSFGRAVEV